MIIPFSAIPKSLVIYSSPSNLDRLRLDKEHKAIEEVLTKHKLPQTIIRRIHAATLRDVSKTLREQDYEVVFFSCHGSTRGLYLEGTTRYTETSWELLSRTLKDGAPNLSVVLLNACHSEAGQGQLHTAAAFLIVMDGAADDDAAIVFGQQFFDEYYRSHAIEYAFHQAVSALEQMGVGDKIKPVLIRRERSGHSVVQAVFGLRQDSIFIDVTEAEESISNLPITRHAFLSLLTRKIRVHSWIFKTERERAIVPIGQYFGVFSWRNAKDVVQCHEVLQTKSGLSVSECMGWTMLMVLYNDLRSERYRVMESPSAAENEGLLASALESVEYCYQVCKERTDVSLPAQALAPQQYAVTLATVRSQCDVARLNMKHSDLSRVVIALETAISSLHDLVDELTKSVTAC